MSSERTDNVNGTNGVTNGLSYVDKSKKNPLNATFVPSTDEEKEKEEEKDQAPPISFLKLYTYASTRDKVCISFGIIGPIVTGCTTPVNTLIFGTLVDSMVTQGGNAYRYYFNNENRQFPPDFDPDLITEWFLNEVTWFAIYSCILGIVMLIGTYLSIMLFNFAAHSQIFRIRGNFLRSVLNQDIAWYDVNQSGEFASRMNEFNNSLLSLVAISATDNSTATVITNRANIVKTSNGISAFSNMTADQDKAKNPAEAAQIINNSQVVCFDVDSTVIREEGIDELAKFCGKGQEVARLTKEAMKGSMTFQEALRLRLNIIKPSQKQIRDFLKAHPSTLSNGVKDLVNRLKVKQIKVYLISGGFDCLIEPVAAELGIPIENMFANKLQFYFNGEYAGFDTNQPTSRSGGKGEAINAIRKKLADDANITMIGDGATDLEASPPADNFVGYGGNIVRDEVRASATYYITDFEKLTQAL